MPPRWWAVGCAATLGVYIVWAAPTFGMWPPLLLRSTQISMPPGWYVYAHAPPARVGETVILRYPPHYRAIGLTKRVRGVAGDLFCWRPDLGTHTLNGVAMPAPTTRAKALGIPIWTGCRSLEPGEVVGYGDSPDSYDSRYFGPVRESDLWGVYRLWIAMAT
jgi:type IV secretory pathway protease TraF